jgi:dynein assembly factor 3
MEALGFISLWGFTPSIDFFQGTDLSLESEQELNVLITECADIRHLLRTLSDNLPLKSGQREKPLNIYIHEKQKENLCRDILLLTCICERNLSMRERQEMFLDLYGNSMIRDKTAGYLESIVKELIMLITEDERCQNMLKPILNFDTLRFKDRDDMEEVFSSYLKKHPFDIEKLRDHRLRHHFADRYDTRRNQVDWDY